jgi:hypothetical protein
VSDMRHRCQSCGRYMTPGAPGVSSWQTWGYCMDGSPDLHDPVFQCSLCTDKNGYQHSNCHPPEAYQWRNPPAARPTEAKDD